MLLLWACTLTEPIGWLLKSRECTPQHTTLEDFDYQQNLRYLSPHFLPVYNSFLQQFPLTYYSQRICSFTINGVVSQLGSTPSARHAMPASEQRQSAVARNLLALGVSNAVLYASISRQVLRVAEDKPQIFRWSQIGTMLLSWPSTT